MYQRPQRKPNRLKGFDYCQSGWYFVTVCVKNRECLFGYVENGKMILNDLGKIVQACWQDLPKHYFNCQLEEFAVMPNHVHGIIIIDNTVGNGFKPVGTGLKPVPTLSEIIRGFKTFSARRINEKRKTIGNPVWQRSFYDHIIRHEKSYWAIKEYIRNNPLNWAEDEENPNK